MEREIDIDSNRQTERRRRKGKKDGERDRYRQTDMDRCIGEFPICIIFVFIHIYIIDIIVYRCFLASHQYFYFNTIINNNYNPKVAHNLNN